MDFWYIWTEQNYFPYFTDFSSSVDFSLFQVNYFLINQLPLKNTYIFINQHVESCSKRKDEQQK